MAKHARRSAKVPNEFALPHPFPGIERTLTVAAARKFLAPDTTGFDGFLWFLREAMKAAKTSAERQACDAYIDAVSQAIKFAQAAVQTRRPVRVNVSGWGDLEHARAIALVLSAHARADAGDAEYQDDQRRAFALLLAEILERMVAKAGAEQDARLAAQPTREQLFSRSADLAEEARRLRTEAECEEDDELERLRPLVAAKLTAKRARADRLEHEAATIEHQHFNGPKPAPLSEGAL